MPELPEVETTRAGIEPHVRGQTVRTVVVRQPQLRWPVSPELAAVLPGQAIHTVHRRAKYLLFETDTGHVCLHLGMSGRLRIVPADTPVATHDHLDIVLENDWAIRFNDTRRFGSVFWLEGAPETFSLLAHLGPEPLGDAFDGDWLYARSRGKRASVKTFIMDSATVVGVGNIYAQESLFLAGIHPSRPAGRISEARYQRLALAIRSVLAKAIEAGGTTLRDFTSADGQPGYFAQQLLVYGRAGEPCPQCAEPLRGGRHGQRSTVYCPRCQR